MITTNKNNFFNSARNLLEQAKKEEDYEKKYFLLLSYKSILTFLHCEERIDFSKLLNIMETYKDNIFLWKTLIGFYRNCLKVHIFESNNELFTIFDKLVKLPTDYIETKDILSMVKSFYGNLDEEIYGSFIDFVGDSNNTIFLSNNYLNRNNKDYSINGFSVTSEFGINKYLLINNENNHLTYTTLIHELAHAITSSKEIDHSDVYFNPYEEIESLFIEMIALFEGMKNDDSLLFDYYMMKFLDSNLFELKSIYKQWVLIKEWQNNDFVVDKKYFDSINTYGITKKKYDELCGFDFFECVPYLNSMRVVLRLFNIYKNDKKTAIELYKKISYGNISDKVNAINSIKNIDPVSEVVDIQNKVLSRINKRHL